MGFRKLQTYNEACTRQVFEERLPNGRRVPSPRRPRQQRQQRSEGRRPPRQDGIREEGHTECVRRTNGSVEFEVLD